MGKKKKKSNLCISKGIHEDKQAGCFLGITSPFTFL